MSEFDEFLKSQKERKIAEADWLKRKGEWLKQVESLYAKTIKLLHPYASSFSHKTEEITIYEEAAGSYQVPSLVIQFASDTLRFKPIGTYIFGSPGRVDLVGPGGSVRFVLVQPGEVKPSIRVTFAEERKKPGLPEPPLSSYVWKIPSEPPSIRYSELTPENLQKAILRAAHG